MTVHRRIELVASLELVPPSHGQPPIVLDRATGMRVTLEDLLGAFSDGPYGPLRITIEPATPASIWDAALTAAGGEAVEGHERRSEAK